jgi:hypothetical protein
VHLLTLRWGLRLQLLASIEDAAPCRATGQVTVYHEPVGAGGSHQHGIVAVTFHHQQRGAPDFSVGGHRRPVGGFRAAGKVAVDEGAQRGRDVPLPVIVEEQSLEGRRLFLKYADQLPRTQKQLSHRFERVGDPYAIDTYFM